MLRYIEPSDFETISPHLNDWWGGRSISGLLPRLFFEHFRPTSFVIEENGHLKGFLAGFQSQTHSSVAYIHFVGVAPEVRGKGYGRMLYEHFFGIVRDLGCTEVHSLTSPVNTGSIRFHQCMGFRVLDGDGDMDGVPVHLNHAGPGQHRVLFRRSLQEDA